MEDELDVAMQTAEAALKVLETDQRPEAFIAAMRAILNAQAALHRAIVVALHANQ